MSAHRDADEIQRVDAEVGIGQVMEIENGPALPFEDDGASEAQHPFRDDAVRAAVAAAAAFAALAVARRRERLPAGKSH